MRKTPLLLVASCLLIVALVGCDNDPVPTTINTTRVDFPNFVGSRWTYEYNDNLDSVTDTVEVTIVGLKTLANGEAAKIWIADFSARADTHFVSQVDDTVKMYWTGLVGPMTFLLPLEVGKSWTNPEDPYDSTTVVGSAMGQVSPGVLLMGYRLERRLHDPSHTEETDVLLVPNVGIVVMVLKSFEIGSEASGIDETWQLLEYELVD